MNGATNALATATLLAPVRCRDTLLLAADIERAERTLANPHFPARTHRIARDQVTHFGSLLADTLTPLLGTACQACGDTLGTCSLGGCLECDGCGERWAVVDAVLVEVSTCRRCDAVVIASDGCEDCIEPEEMRERDWDAEYDARRDDAMLEAA